MTRANPLTVTRDAKIVAEGAELPSGTIVVEWDRTAFPEGERTEENTLSIYSSREDAAQGTGGTIDVKADWSN